MRVASNLKMDGLAVHFYCAGHDTPRTPFGDPEQAYHQSELSNRHRSASIHFANGDSGNVESHSNA